MAGKRQIAETNSIMSFWGEGKHTIECTLQNDFLGLGASQSGARSEPSSSEGMTVPHQNWGNVSS